MNKLLTAIFAAALFAAPSQAATPEERGREIAEITDKADQGFKGESAKMVLKLINAHGDVIERKMNFKMKEGPVGQAGGDKSMFSFDWPADVKGTRLLTWTHADRDDDRWLYLPAIKRVKRISSSGKSGSFMGSEFSYEDLTRGELDKYNYKYIKDDVVNGRPVWVTERYPKDKDSGYSKMVNWTDQEYKNVVKAEYYDRKGELLKTAEFRGYEKIAVGDKSFWRFKEIEMTNHQTRKKSIIAWEGRTLGAEFKDSEFDQTALEQ